MTDRNIVLTGFMGTGKSSVGKILAAGLRREFIDIDQWIEDKQKKKIAHIFESEGEAHFRAIEKEAIAEVTAKKNIVLTTGGGAILDADNRKRLRESGFVILLTATPETIYDRVKGSRRRPLLNNNTDLLTQIKTLLEMRAPFYEDCDLKIDTNGQNAQEVASRLLKILSEKDLKAS